MTTPPTDQPHYSLVRLINDMEARRNTPLDHPTNTPARNTANPFPIIAGPCSVESESQIVTIAKSVRNAGAAMLRGGAYKPRTSPHSFRGLGEDGLKMLATARAETGLPVVTEVMSVKYLDLVAKYTDVIQIGARNAQNFTLLEEVGRSGVPVLLKRGMSMTYEEVCHAVEYITQGGNTRVIVCERGIRTFETGVRNTLDIAAVPILQSLIPYPVIVDPSHIASAKYVSPLALSAVAAGADGIIIEVHNNPSKALSDAKQAITTEEFAELAPKLQHLHRAISETEA